MAPPSTLPPAKSPAKSPSPEAATSPKSAKSDSPAIQEGENLEHDNDGDSAIGSGSLTSTESLTESIFEYRKLHGRTYQNSKTTEYWAPNDDQQNEGLDIFHNALVMMMEDKLFLAPVGKDPGRVLDVGTGTGIWAIDFADQYPSAEVIGTDISPIQPSWIPPNLRFMIDDCLLDWTWPPDHFDLVHIRALYGSVPDWTELYKKAFLHLKPGGWLQDLEMDVKLCSDHVDFPPEHAFNVWGNCFYEAGEKMGRSFAISCDHNMRDHMAAAGFVDIVETKIKVPSHGWPQNPRLQQVGYLVQLTLEQSLEGLAMFSMTEILDWSRDEATVLLAKVRAEMRKKSNCTYIWTTVVYGRKPLAAPA